MEKIKVLIADDHELFREGLKKILARDAALELHEEVGDGQGAINIVRKNPPDIILMDIHMPGTNGILATEVIKREVPETKIIALTIYEDDEVVDMIKAGASAYVLKDVAGKELIDIIKRVYAGEIVIDPQIANRLAQELTHNGENENEAKLTKREKDVLLLLVKGYSNKDMAQAMYISEKTVKNHLTNIFRKLGVKDRTQAAIFALKNGFSTEMEGIKR